MSIVTVITVGRDDDYGGAFLQRFNMSIRTNIEYLSSENIDFDYLIVDWFPYTKDGKVKYLHDNDTCKDIYENSNVHGLVVDNSISKTENLNKKSFYELFAKNAGVRHSNTEWVLIVNSDVIIPPDLCKEVKSIIENNKPDSSNEDVFYRTRFRTEINPCKDIHLAVEDALSRPGQKGTNDFLGHIVDIDKDLNPDNHVLGAFGGDFLLLRKNIFEEIGKGYDETNEGHRSKSKRQSTMDTELLLNLHKNGARLRHLMSPYIHIMHDHPFRYNRTEEAFNGDGYSNKDNWGFIDYPKKQCENTELKILKIYKG